MSDIKEQVTSAIARAQADLDVALAELEKMPAFDPSAVAFAAHALNNFLTVTDGTVELLMMKLANHDDDQVRSWLKAVQHCTNLMTRTVGQMMTASATSETKMRIEPVDLPTLVERACRYYDRLASRKSITVTLAPGEPVPQVRTDRVAVAAILDNLLSNAVKYSPAGRHVGVHVRADRDGVICGVHDDGPGLTRDDQARLFQKGARLTPQPTGGEASTGYGLAVAKELVEKLGGTIWCESVPGHGSNFLFRLPLEHEMKQTNP